MKNTLLLLIACIFTLPVFAEAKQIRNEESHEYFLLDHFFRFALSKEDYGYVLMGAKPIGLREFALPTHFQIPVTNFDDSIQVFYETLLAHAFIPLWKKYFASQKGIHLKTVEIFDPAGQCRAIEFAMIHVEELRKTVAENLPLFRYILGAGLQCGEIVDRILFEKTPLGEILQEDLTLMGIVLGYQTHNSLIGGRIETIIQSHLSKDEPLKAPRTSFMHTLVHQNDPHPFAQYYSLYYLDDSLKNDPAHAFPQDGKKSPSELLDEMQILEQLTEELPQALTQKNPKFIFGAYKGDENNHKFFKKLTKAQKETQKILLKANPVETIAKKILGNALTIPSDISKSLSLGSALKNYANTDEWAHFLDQLSQKSGNTAAFIRSFIYPSATDKKPPSIILANQRALRGLLKARENLAKAHAYFADLSKNKTLQMIDAKGIYYQLLTPGSGKTLDREHHVRLGYIVEDLNGNILYANCDTWLDLFTALPGLSHSLQGMRVNERRKVYLHPAFAYGALTTIDPCAALIITIHLIDIDLGSPKSLPSLNPWDLEWIDDEYFSRKITESIIQIPRYSGHFYRQALNGIEGLDVDIIGQKLRALHSRNLQQLQRRAE